MAEFYSARGWEIPPLPWTNLSPPFSAEEQKGQLAGIYYTDDLIVEPFGFADGAIRVPDGPGFGNDVSLAKVERYRRRLPS